MAEMIYVDADGKEIRREPKGRGRPPKRAIQKPNGDLIIPPPKIVRIRNPEYIDLDEDGNVVKREAKGRGRPRPGYAKRADGEFAGHWVRVVSLALVEDSG